MVTPPQLKLNGKLFISTSEGPVIGPGRVELLEYIQQYGSIRQAAMRMKMSYRQAWQMIDHMNTQLAEPVVILRRGGKNGGNAQVTPKGQKVITQFHQFYQKFHTFLNENSSLIEL